MVKWLFDGMGDRKCLVFTVFCFFSMLVFADQFSQVTLYYINSRLYARGVYYLIIVLLSYLVVLLYRFSVRDRYAPISCRNMVYWSAFFFVWLLVSTVIFGMSDYKIAFRAFLHYVWFVTAVFFVCRYVNATKMIRFYLVTYYILCLVMLFTVDSSVTTFDFNEGEFRVLDEVRKTSSLAYLIKNGLYIGLYLFVAGLIKQRGMGVVSRFLCVFAVVPYLYFMVAQFKFRTCAVLVILVLVVVAWNSVKRMKIAPLIAVSTLLLVGAAVVSSTGVFQGFMERMETKRDEYASVDSMGFWRSERLIELQMMLHELTPLEHIIGRGFSAHWDASDMFGENAGWKWRAVHMGVFVPILFGGWPFMVFWVFVYVGAVFKRIDPNSWYAEDLHVCRIFVLILFIRNITGPVPFVAPEYADLPQYLSLGMLWMIDRGRIRWLDMKGSYA